MTSNLQDSEALQLGPVAVFRDCRAVDLARCRPIGHARYMRHRSNSPRILSPAETLALNVHGKVSSVIVNMS